MKLIAPLSLLVSVILFSGRPAVFASAGSAYAPPASPRAIYNFDPGWKFMRGDVTGAEAAGFDDSGWTEVGLPHTWNDVDTYRALISHPAGDVGNPYRGVAWYRKHFKLPAGSDGRKIFLEFEGLKQAARFYLNGQPLGKFENGVSACGLDLTALVKYGGQDNVLAVKVDNTIEYKEEATGTPYEWKFSNSNPNFGGLNRDVWRAMCGCTSWAKCTRRCRSTRICRPPAFTFTVKTMTSRARPPRLTLNPRRAMIRPSAPMSRFRQSSWTPTEWCGRN